jgi:hypothetical protein
MLRDDGEQLPAAVLWLEWSTESGNRDQGPILGPVAVPLTEPLATISVMAEWLLEGAGYRRTGDWSDTACGMVAWIDPAGADATPRSRRDARNRCPSRSSTRPGY